MEDPFALGGPPPGMQDNQSVRNEIVGRLEGRVSPQEVNLRPAEETSAMCGECINYEMKGAPASPCMKVASEVRAEQVCDIFEPEALGQGLPPELLEGAGGVQPPNEMM